MPVLGTAQQRQSCSPLASPGQQACGAPLYSQNVVLCPSNGTAGQCVISVEFLACIADQDQAIRINPSDSVLWYSDEQDPYGQRYKFKFNKFKELKHSDHKECLDPKDGDPDLFKKAVAEDYDYQHKDTADATARACTCYKHSIKLKDSKGGIKNFDPHVIIGDGTSYLAANAKMKKERAQAKKPDSDKKKQQ